MCDYFKGYSFFSEPSSEGNKKLCDDMQELKDPINPNHTFLEESSEKDYWISQLSPTLSCSQFQSHFKDDVDSSQTIVNSSPSTMSHPNVEIITLYHNNKKTSNNHLYVLKGDKKMDIFRHRKNFSEIASNILKNWLLENKENPYPTTSQLNYLVQITGLTNKQIRTYFVNNRSRLLSRSPKGGKVIKSKKLLREEEESKNNKDIIDNDNNDILPNDDEDSPNTNES